MSQLLTQIQPSDALLLTQISQKTFVETYQNDISHEIIQQYFAHQLNLNTILAEINTPNNLFYFICHQNQIAGFVKIIFHPNNSLEVSRFYILKSFQNQKLGQTVFQQIIDLATQKNCQKIFLNVWEKNPKAIAFYTKIGFQKSGDVTFFLHKTPFNDHQMTLILS